jgi:hypothetical protein
VSQRQAPPEDRWCPPTRRTRGRTIENLSCGALKSLSDRPGPTERWRSSNSCTDGLNDGDLHDIAVWLAYHVGDRWDELTPLVGARMQ